jgi:hypothetical protein
MGIPAHIPLGLARLPVYSAVQFHDESPLRATKIDDVVIGRDLPPELEAPDPESPQQTPRRLLSFRCRLAKVARSVNQFYATRD